MYLVKNKRNEKYWQTKKRYEHSDKAMKIAGAGRREERRSAWSGAGRDWQQHE